MIGRQYCFAIVSEYGSWYIATSSDQCRKEWMDSIRSCISITSMQVKDESEKFLQTMAVEEQHLFSTDSVSLLRPVSNSPRQPSVSLLPSSNLELIPTTTCSPLIANDLLSSDSITNTITFDSAIPLSQEVASTIAKKT